MTEGLPQCELEIDFYSSGSAHFEDSVTWNKDQKTLTSICSFTRGKDGSSEQSLCGAPEAFEDYKGKNLRVKLNGKQVTLSVRVDVPTYNDKGCFQIAYSECREGWFTKEIFFEVQRLAEWVYSERWKDYRIDVSKDFGNRSEVFGKWLTDNRKSWLAHARFGDGLCMYFIKTADDLPEKFDFKYLNEDFTLTLYSECTSGCDLRVRFSYEWKCHFGITSSREHDKEFFETLIRRITYFLSLVFGKKAVTNRIFESVGQQLQWDCNPSEKESSADASAPFRTSYDAIRGEFGNKLTKWLKVCERYETIIDSFFHDEHKRFPNKGGSKVMTREEKERMQDVFLKRLNRLEMYGNILTKGHDTSKDIGEAVSAVDNEAVSGIIRKILSRYGVFPILPIYTFGETPEDKKKDFVEIVTAFRNYFVHPFRDGKKKHLLPKGLKNFLQQHRLDRWQILKKQ